MAKKAYEVSPGLKLDFALPVATNVGQGVLVGDVFGYLVAAPDGKPACAIGERGTLGLTGLWADADKTAGEAWTEGQALYWNNATRALTTTVGSNKKVGNARYAALAADVVGWIRLLG